VVIGADHDRVAVAPDALEACDAMQIDQVLRAREPELHHWNQAVAAGQRPGLVAKRRKQVHGVGHRCRPVIAERARNHAFPPFVLCGRSRQS
jgi:hypothetical protein